MRGLLPKRRTHQEIERADDLLLRKHDAYFQTWLKKAAENRLKREKPSSGTSLSSRKTQR